MTGTKPLLLGFTRPTNPSSEVERIGYDRDLHAFAAREGYTLGVIYRETAHNSGAFGALVAAAIEHGAAGVVVPSLDHFGTPPSHRIAHLKHHAAGVRVYAVDASGT